MNFEFLFQPVEDVDAWLEGLFAGSPFVFVLVIALLLGLRHASDPDHLVAITSLVAADRGDVRGAARLGAWWGIGHAAALVVIGVPLIFFKSELPAWLERGAETAVGVVILLLALRIVVKWLRGDFRAGRHEHRPVQQLPRHRHLRRASPAEHPHRRVRTRGQALGIGGPRPRGDRRRRPVADRRTRHRAPGRRRAGGVRPDVDGLDGAVHDRIRMAPTRPVIDPVYRTVLIPAFGIFGVMFGTWYIGIG